MPENSNSLDIRQNPETEQNLSLDQQYIQQVKQLISMLNSHPSTKIYANQVQVFQMNHKNYLIAKEQWMIMQARNQSIRINRPQPNISTSRVLEGYQKMQEYIQKMNKLTFSGKFTVDQIDMQIYLVISLLQGF